jgi:hypothetical protein
MANINDGIYQVHVANRRLNDEGKEDFSMNTASNDLKSMQDQFDHCVDVYGESLKVRLRQYDHDGGFIDIESHG